MKRAVSGDDHANLNRDAFFPANPSDLVVFENAKKFRLKLGLHLSYFVEEDGAAIGLLEDPEAPARGESLAIRQQTLDASIRVSTLPLPPPPRVENL